MNIMTNAFNQLEQATSIADLRTLVDSLDATAPWLDNPLGLTVQLYGGITLDNKGMNKVVEKFAGTLMPDGTTLLTVDQTILGRLLLEKNLFLEKLTEIVKNNLKSSIPGFETLNHDEKIDLIYTERNKLLNNADKHGNRLPYDPSNLSFWDTVSKKFIQQNDGDVRIAAGNAHELSVLMQTEIPELLKKSGDFEIDGISKNLIAAAGDLEAQKGMVLTNAITHTFVSGLRLDDSTSWGRYTGMTPELVNTLLGDGTILSDGKTLAQQLDDYAQNKLTGGAKGYFKDTSQKAMKIFESLADFFSPSTLEKAGKVFGALGFLAAAHQAKAAAENGDYNEAALIMVDYTAETIASNVFAGVLSFITTTVVAAAATVAGVTIGTPAIIALSIAAGLLGGYFGGDAVKPWLEYLRDRDQNGRMDALDKMGKLLFGDEYGKLQTIPQALIDKQLMLQSDAISHAIGEQVTREEIVQNAKDSIAWRYALKHLNAFVVEGVDYASHNQDGSLDLYDSTTGEGAMSDTYLSARADMLTWKIRFDRGRLDNNDFFPHNGPKPYDEDWDTNLVEGNWDLVDLGTIINGKPLQLAIDGNGLTIHDHQIVFGTDANDELKGSGSSDQLFGGAGNDTLKGFDGNDYLEGNVGNDILEAGIGKNILAGGKGNDTYIIENDGEPDTIIDSDGQGKIQLDGNTISGTFKPPQGESGPNYYSENAKYRLTEAGEGEWHLFENSNNTHLAILKHWKDGDLGIQLGEADKEDDATETATFYEMDFSDKSIWVNTNATGAPKGLLYIGSNKANSVAGSSHKDLIITGEGNNYVMSGGDNDHVIGGSGKNYIRSGSNIEGENGDNDLVQAGQGTDMVYGGAGDDEIWANRVEIWDNENKTWVAKPGNGPSAFATQFDSYQRGDWLSGEGGDDFIVGSHQKDLIFGGAGADFLFGGAGNDLILGDAQYSVLSGAMSLSWAQGQTQSWVWDSNYNGFKSLLKQADYASHPVRIPKGAIHQWDWVLDYEDGFTITLAPGINWLSQTRIAVNGGDDYIEAGEGDDFIDGQSGNDTIHCGPGNDIAHGGEGDDQLHGDDGNDELYGGPGNDLLSGGEGNDYLSGGDGHDWLHGGVDINILHGGAGNDTYHITGSSTTCMDSDGIDTYVIHWDSLQQGGIATIDDRDGLGNLVFDGWYININTVFAISENEWHIQGNNGQGILSQQGNDLHITAEGADGNVVVQNFFSQDDFLNLTLPEYNTQMQNMAFTGNIHSDTLKSSVFIDPYDSSQDTPMIFEPAGMMTPMNSADFLL